VIIITSDTETADLAVDNDQMTVVLTFDFTSTYRHIHSVSKKTSTHILGYKLRNSCPILIIFDIKIPHII